MSLITAELAAFLEGPNSMMVATRDADFVPEIARVVFLRCAPEGDRIAIAIRAAEARTLENARANGRIAVSAERMASHKTMQVKGRMVGVRPLRDDERPDVERAFEAFVRSAEEVGMPRRVIERVARWPLVELEIAVEELYDQSPGPGAGARLAGGRAP
jgi:hypothetical protein